MRIVYGDTKEAVGASPLATMPMLGHARFPATKVRGLTSHCHTAFEICLIVDGAVTWCVGEERHIVRRGDVFFTRPGEWHGGADTMMHPCTLYWLHVLESPENAALLTALYTDGPRRFPAPAVLPHFERLLREHQCPGPLCAEAIQATLHLLLIETVRARPTAARFCSPTITAALAFMETHLCEAFTIDSVAQNVGLPTARFYERFVAETGETPAQWRTRQRIEQAKTRLACPHNTVTDIALYLGFATPQAFATAFKRHTGRTPTEYRQRDGER